MRWRPRNVTRKSPEEAWRLLRHGGHEATASDIPSRKADINADAGPVRFALSFRGEGRLLLPLGPSERTPGIPQTPSLEILDRYYTLDGVRCRYLDLTCTVRELEGVFAEVATEILRRIQDGESALRACTGTLNEFRLLLLPGASDVSDEQITGLIGELLLLTELLSLSADAVALWRGPLGERHDFRGGALAIEVKTTLRAGTETMRISSLDQLLEPAGGELCVTRYTLERAAGGALTVSGLLRRTIELGADRTELKMLLAAMGCAEPESEVWNGIACELQESRSYRVDADFPRLIPTTTPGGINEVSYAVELATATACLLDDQQAQKFRSRMVECLSQS